MSANLNQNTGDEVASAISAFVVIEQFDVGEKTTFPTRWDVFKTMKRGEAQFFRAATDVQRASVRGSAYGYARSGIGSGKKFVCRHIKPDIVGVYREA